MCALEVFTGRSFLIWSGASAGSLSRDAVTAWLSHASPTFVNCSMRARVKRRGGEEVALHCTRRSGMYRGEVCVYGPGGPHPSRLGSACSHACPRGRRLSRARAAACWGRRLCRPAAWPPRR